VKIRGADGSQRIAWEIHAAAFVIDNVALAKSAVFASKCHFAIFADSTGSNFAPATANCSVVASPPVSRSGPVGERSRPSSLDPLSPQLHRSRAGRHRYRGRFPLTGRSNTWVRDSSICKSRPNDASGQFPGPLRRSPVRSIWCTLRECGVSRVEGVRRSNTPDGTQSVTQSREWNWCHQSLLRHA
jgi:hypothetical protein